MKGRRREKREDNARGGGVEGEPCGEKKKREDRSLGS